MHTKIDASVQYDGPRAEFASFTGSPLWGYGVDGVIERAEAQGWQVARRERLNTPYGLSPLVVHFVTETGRDVLWIPSYGEVVGEGLALPSEFRKEFLGSVAGRRQGDAGWRYVRYCRLETR